MLYNRNPISKSSKVQQTCLDHYHAVGEAGGSGCGVGVGEIEDRLPQMFSHGEPNCLHSKQKISTMSVQSRGGGGGDHFWRG